MVLFLLKIVSFCVRFFCFLLFVVVLVEIKC